MLVVNTKEIFLQNLHQNRVHFPAERNSFVFDHQHGCRDVTCKPAIQSLVTKLHHHFWVSVDAKTRDTAPFMWHLSETPPVWTARQMTVSQNINYLHDYAFLAVEMLLR